MCVVDLLLLLLPALFFSFLLNHSMLIKSNFNLLNNFFHPFSLATVCCVREHSTDFNFFFHPSQAANACAPETLVYLRVDCLFAFLRALMWLEKFNEKITRTTDGGSEELAESVWA